VDPAAPRAVRGPARLLRGWAGALAMTLLAALFHSAAAPGHPTPGALELLTCVVLAAPVCTALAGQALSLWRTAGAVLGAQAVFHTVYAVSHGGHAAVLNPTGGGEHLGHVHPAAAGAGPALDLVLAPSAAPDAGETGLTMLLAHLVAALLTLGVLRWGERAVVAAAERVLEAALILWVRRRPVLPPHPRRAPVVRDVAPVRSQLVLSTPGRRGPPFVLAA